MITLRELREDDAPLMLEWMHDKEIQEAFKHNMMDITLEEAKDFCRKASEMSRVPNADEFNYAVTDENDEYLGTISLKNVDFANKTAEYAIVIRRDYWGSGVAKEATRMVMEKAFVHHGLNRVYLSVFADNYRAIKLYEDCGFKLEGEFREHIFSEGIFKNWRWYGILSREYNELYG